MSASKILNFPRSFPRDSCSPLRLAFPLRISCRCRSTGVDSMSQTSESDVGIFCFASSLPGFRGVLKRRYSDFIVNEVDSNGMVVRLTCCDAPSEDADFIDTTNIAHEGIALCDETVAFYAAELESFKSLAGADNAENLEKLLEQINSGLRGNLSPILLSPDSDKSHRTAVHNFFKKNFNFLITDTVEGPDDLSKCIRVRFHASKQRGIEGAGRDRKRKFCRSDVPEGEPLQPFDSRGAKNWPENIGKFLRFHLYKENKSTQEALMIIGKLLGVQQKTFGFAGTKDKRAITTQRVTVFKQHARRLASLNDRLIGIKIGDFQYVQEELVLGQLFGNRFVVTLRGVESDSVGAVEAAADGLGKNGFINYFGLQRFGSGSVPTHLIGASLLRGEWKAAVDLILNPRDGERDMVKEAREHYKSSGDVEGALKRLPRHMIAERTILQTLKKCPGNYLQALKTIPRPLRMMYVHSYQSYLWNHAASLRIQRHGISKPMVGDLVYCKQGSLGKVTMDTNIEYEDHSSDEYASDTLEDASQAEGLEEKIEHVKVLNSEDLESDAYSFEDVVLPLPGCRVIYPMNDMERVYHDIAKKDNIVLTESSHNVKEFSITSLTGAYRRIFQKPVDYEWKLLKYADPNISLSETDVDVIAKSKGVSTDINGTETLQLKGKENEGSERTSSVEQKSRIEGEPLEYTALKLSFTLPASCYATMAIRELLKTSTSVAFHKTLNE